MKAAFSSGFSKGPGPLEKGITLRPALFRTQSVQKNTLSAQSVFHDVHAAVKNDLICSLSADSEFCEAFGVPRKNAAIKAAFFLEQKRRKT